MARNYSSKPFYSRFNFLGLLVIALGVFVTVGLVSEKQIFQNKAASVPLQCYFLAGGTFGQCGLAPVCPDSTWALDRNKGECTKDGKTVDGCSIGLAYDVNTHACLLPFSQCKTSGDCNTVPQTPSPTTLPAGGSCQSGWCTLSKECTDKGGKWGGKDSYCSQGSLGDVGQCCLPGDTTTVPPTAASQGTVAYCQDGNGPVYPLAGVNVKLHDTAGTVHFYNQTTNSQGRAFFSSFDSSGDFDSTINGLTFAERDINGNWSQVVNPFKTHPTYASMKLANGQPYTELKPGDTYGSVFQQCQNPGWFLYCNSGCGRFANWFCKGAYTQDKNPPTNGYKLSSTYFFDVPNYNKGQYGIQFHFSNCTPGSTPAPSCGPATKSVMGNYSTLFKNSSAVYFNNVSITITSQLSDGSFSGTATNLFVYGNTSGSAVTLHIINATNGVQFTAVGTIDASGNWSGNWKRSDNNVVGTFTLTRNSCVDAPGCPCNPAPNCSSCNTQFDAFWGPTINNFSIGDRYSTTPTRLITTFNDKGSGSVACGLTPNASSSPVVVPTLSSGCDNPVGRGYLTASYDQSNTASSKGGYVKVTITNKSTSCTYPVGAATYKAAWTTTSGPVSDSEVKPQNLFDSKTSTLGPNSSTTFTIKMPTVSGNTACYKLP